MNSYSGHLIIKCTFTICAILCVVEKKRAFKTFEANWVENCIFCFKKKPCDCSRVKDLPVSRWMFGLCFHSNLQERTLSLLNGTQHSINQGTRETAGGGQRRMRVERDRWMEEAERKNCEGWTDGGERGDSSEEENGGQREEGERVNIEKRNSIGGIEERRNDRSEVGLLTLAVSQAICVTMLHVLLKGWSAGNRDIMVSSGKQARPCRLATPNEVTKL